MFGGLRGALLYWISDFLRGGEMRTMVKDRKSSWREVISGVPQESVLTPFMFAIYVYHMMEGVE